MECLAEMPREVLSCRPRKRQRLGWDVGPEVPQVQMGLSGQQVANVITAVTLGLSLDPTLSSQYVQVVPRYASPPIREDDKDGHYVFAVGDNLTSRYKINAKMGEVMHELRLIHTDLKPENILLVSPEYIRVPGYKVSSRSPKESSYYKRLPKSSAIKVIDFGSTTYNQPNQKYVVSTRHYRAPEVILGLGWSYPCDIWSVGCILVELCTGETLFQTHENLEHLAMMEMVFGPLPYHMLKRADRPAEKYIRKGRLNWPEGCASRESMKAVMELPRLQNLVMQHADDSAGDFADLLQGLLRYNPADRFTAKEALRHPFLS